MDQPLKWLPDAGGLPVPAGFIVFRCTPEQDVRAAYEELKTREKTHFVAVRGPTHAVLNVIGPDRLIHTLRRLWTETPDAPVTVQRMIHSMWCGKAEWHGKDLTITANERKMIRHVDGTAKIVERQGSREPMPAEYLAKVAELATRAGSDITWAIDDL